MNVLYPLGQVQARAETEHVVEERMVYRGRLGHFMRMIGVLMRVDTLCCWPLYSRTAFLQDGLENGERY